jgi:hypothetical protein
MQVSRYIAAFEHLQHAQHTTTHKLLHLPCAYAFCTHTAQQQQGEKAAKLSKFISCQAHSQCQCWSYEGLQRPVPG